MTNEDTISRRATVERLCKVAKYMNEKRNGLGSPYVMAALFIQDNKEEFPSVTPKQSGWTPVSERLPEENGYYLTTTMYHEVYCDYWEEERFNRTEAVIAWMPLPAPYKAESEEV